MKNQVEEPLLPPWVKSVAMKIVPLAGLIIIYVVLNAIGIPGKILTPVLAVLVLTALVYFGGRFYKPFRVKKDGKCLAKGAREREGCRQYIPGAKMGGGCGRLMENGKCRYVKG